MSVPRKSSWIRSRRGGAAAVMPVVLLGLLTLPIISCVDDASDSPTDPGAADPIADPGQSEDPRSDPAEGTIYVETVTSGSRLDFDGYFVAVDGTIGPAVRRSGSVSISGVSAGEHSVELAGIAFNCQATVPNPQTVTVDDPFESPFASFYVYCD